jgi:DNA-binding IclR family transcriptional regulator
VAKTTKSRPPVAKPLERYMRVLEVLAGFSNGISLSPVADLLDLPKTTVHRLLKGLVDVGMVELVDRGAPCYQLGPRFVHLLYAGATENWIGLVGQPLLKELALQTDQACFIAKLSGNDIRSVAMTAPDNAVRSYVVPGAKIVPHAGASAKAILAFQDEDIRVKVLQSPLPRITRHTKTSMNVLLTEFATIRKTGIAHCVGEDVEGFAGIAAPVIVPGMDVVYSIALTGTIEGLINQGRQLHERRLKLFAEKLATAIMAQLPKTSKKIGQGF